MANTKTTIELNGKTYNAATGQLVQDVASPSPTPSPVAPAAPTPPATGQNMDGFIKPTRKPQPPRPLQAHTPQKPNTLMRQAVSKPGGDTVESATDSSPRLPSSQNTERAERAEQVTRSPLVNKFGKASPVVEQTVTDVPVQTHPENQPLGAVPPVAPPLPVGDRPAPAGPQTGSQLFNDALQKIGQPSRPVTAPPDMLELPAHATPNKPRKGLRIAGAAGATLVAFLLLGVIIYQNIPGVSLRVADARAGFHATLPSYAPADYSIAKVVHAVPNQITMNFLSKVNSSHYQIIQQPSDWTSQSLAENYVTSVASTYHLLEASGKTIFVYGNSATWVNGGIWYIISGNAGLSNQQIINIANGS